MVAVVLYTSLAKLSEMLRMHHAQNSIQSNELIRPISGAMFVAYRTMAFKTLVYTSDYTIGSRNRYRINFR